MPRISQDQSQERHAFLLDLFRQQPDISRQEALASYKEKFGATISPKILNQLREQAQAGSPTRASTGEPSSSSPSESNPAEEATVRARALNGASELNGAAQLAQKAKPTKGTRQRNLFIDASKEQLAFLERIIQQLQEAGATNVRIDHATDRWMVLVVDAK